MSAQLAPFRDDDNVVELSDGPGRRLRLTRQARGLELDRVAAELHLPPERVAALERDDYEALPGRVFVMGYLRNYARLLGIDPEPLVEAFREAQPEAAGTRHGPASRQAAPAGYLPVALTSLAILIVAGGLAFAWWQLAAPPPTRVDPAPAKSAETAEPVAAAPAASGAPLPTDGEPATDPPAVIAAGQPVGSGEMEPSTAPVGAAGGVVESAVGTVPVAEGAAGAAGSAGEPEQQSPTREPEGAAAAEEPAGEEGTAEAAAAAPARPEIAIAFSGPCWVDIRDSLDDFKLFGEMNKGDRHLLGGEPPYSVILGNTAAASITVDGEPFDLAPYARGNVARFTLDPAARP
jgi:cytoskeleton protein RodZ